MKQHIQEVKKLQKIAGILKENEEFSDSEFDDLGIGDVEKIKELILTYKGKPVDPDFADDFDPYTSNLKIHHFKGQNISGTKSIIVGKDPETGEMAYWEIKSDDEMRNPYGETSDQEGYPTGILN